MDAQVKIVGPQFSNFVRSVMLACEEKGVSYGYGMKIDGQRIGLGDDTHRKYHPYGKIPVLILEDGRSICETTPIIRFIDAEFSGTSFEPQGNFERAQVEQWTSLINIYIDRAFVRKIILEFAFPKGENGEIRMDKVKAAIPEAQQAVAVLEKQLEGKEYICGDQFSMADMMLAPMLDYIEKLPVGEEIIRGNEVLLAYLERLRKRPSGQKVLV